MMLSKRVILILMIVGYAQRTREFQRKAMNRAFGWPPRYSEAALQELGRIGFLIGKRGPGGGYRLIHERQHATVYDVLEALGFDGEAWAAPLFAAARNYRPVNLLPVQRASSVVADHSAGEQLNAAE